MLLVALCATLAGSARAADVYRWTDANGVVHFSDAPPAHVQAEKKEMPPPVPIAKGVVNADAPRAQTGTPAPAAAASGSETQKGPAHVELLKQDDADLGQGRHSYSGTVKNTGGAAAHGVAISVRVTEPTQGDQCVADQITVEPSTLGPGEIGHYSADFDSPCYFGTTQAALDAIWD